MHALAPPENGIKVSLSHSPMNLSGLKVNGSSQYRAAWFPVNYLLGPLDKVILTIVMKPSDVDDDPGPSRDWENSCLTGSVPNDESSVLGTVLYDDRCLGSSTKGYGDPEI